MAIEWLNFRSDGRKRRAAIFPASGARATMLVFPGSGQSVTRFLGQFPAEAWQGRGVSVAIIESRASKGHLWFPATPAQLDAADIRAVRSLLSLLDTLPVTWPKPLWIAGHSGGACFAHIAGIGAPDLVGLAGIISNAGWVWPWATRDVSATPPSVRVCFRVGDKDRLFNRSTRRTAFDGAWAYEQAGCDVRRVTVAGGRHEWLAADDDDLAEWMFANRSCENGVGE